MRQVTRHTNRAGATSYKVRFRLDKRQTSETFDTEREAKHFAGLVDVLGPREALARLYAEDVDRATPTMDQLAEDHIENRTGCEAGTLLTYRRLWKRTWSPLIGGIQANHLTRDHIAKATNTLAPHYSGKSLKNQRGLLAGVCARAVDLGYLPANPSKGLRLPRGNEFERAEMRILDHHEFGLLAEAVHQHYRPFVMFLAGTGCRWGEAVALTVADLQLDGPMPLVRIRRALKWSPDNVRTIGPTKTRKSKRTIVLPPTLVEPLRELIAGKAPGEVVFTAPRGGPIRHRTFWSRDWLPACAAAGLVQRPRIHDLRHTHASWLLAAGVPIHVVQARLGHESIKTTVDTYGHLMPDAQVQAAEAASVALIEHRPELETRHE